ncbi:protein FAR-RED IMPAIRED RESPONSE 1-like [Tripterygium wilfordii]|uniref:protein FAR-RED IMPAIRED RESPONSE 1-like n=1 Tax=Tripterygium wilfordii TaxID=458696 RepID=UPI0018F85B30|nr:protein FAR-RED IMPAIRED RESPONSE 1-like [Tripterygium wilfordii]
MSTTQRSESMHAFFDGYVNSKTTLKQFVEQYDNALRNNVEKEYQADFDSFHKQVPCATFYEMEKQIQSLYTTAKFKEFQTELTGMMYCGIKSVAKSANVSQYVLDEDVVFGEDGMKKVAFNVYFDDCSSEVRCTCFRFEFRGILCRHAITVLIRNGQSLLPSHYVFRRWRKDVRRCHTRVKINYEGWIITSEQRRYDNLCNLFTKVADLAADNDDNYGSVMKWIEDAVKNMSTNRVIGSSSTTNIFSNELK